MPIHAANGVPVQAGWTAAATFDWPFDPRQPAIHVSGFVNGTDVLIQIREDPVSGWADNQSEEILLRQGFNARDLPPFYAWRFRVWPGTLLQSGGTVDMAVHT